MQRPMQARLQLLLQQALGEERGEGAVAVRGAHDTQPSDRQTAEVKRQSLMRAGHHKRCSVQAGAASSDAVHAMPSSLPRTQQAACANAPQSVIVISIVTCWTGEALRLSRPVLIGASRT